MNWREKQTPSAGILGMCSYYVYSRGVVAVAQECILFILHAADDMGLGKTLSMLSLVTAGRVKAKDWVRDTPAKEGTLLLLLLLLLVLLFVFVFGSRFGEVCRDFGGVPHLPHDAVAG